MKFKASARSMSKSFWCAKRLLCVLLVAVMVFLCACNSTPDPADDPTETPVQEEQPALNLPTAVFPIAPTNGTYAYSVLRNEVGSDTERDAMLAICTTLKSIYGTSPKPEIDYDTKDLSDEELIARIEILVGKTGRPESDLVYDALEEGEYTIRVVGNKLVVLGKTDELTAFAVDAFNDMIQNAPTELAADYAYTGSYLRGEYQGPFDFAALGCTKLTDVRFEYRDGENGAKILYVTSDTYHYTYGYYSNNTWVNGDILIAARSDTPDATNFSTSELVALDLKKQEAWLLPITANSYFNYIVDCELLYYLPSSSELRCFNLLTGARHTVLQLPGISFPHSTADGNYISVHRGVNGLYTGTVVDVNTGEYYDVMSYRFEDPNPVANHIMINPTDPTMVFFAHEGTTTEIPDRLWVAKQGEEPYNIAYQRTDAQGKPLDCFGHEYWAPDGKGLYFVKYSRESRIGPTGVCYVSLDDIENPRVLYSKYPYWHTSCSPDQRYITADGLDSGYNGVYLIDTQTDEEILVYKAQNYNWTHPGHPHPCFNTDSSALAFNDRNTKNGQLSIGIYYLFE